MAGVPISLLARFENGQEIPQLATFDRLAEAVGVPLKDLFYGNMDSILTPWLMPRLTLQQLIKGSCHPDESGQAARATH
jgi:transcriptional regulator with XRE-family HTH domain